MNKTNPIGVRFRADLLEKLKNDHGIESPQKALVFYEKFFVERTAYVRPVKEPEKTPFISPSKINPAPKSIELANGSTYEIMRQIEAIRSEKIPPERNTVYGKKSWQIDQQKRIQELQNKLK